MVVRITGFKQHSLLLHSNLPPFRCSVGTAGLPVLNLLVLTQSVGEGLHESLTDLTRVLGGLRPLWNWIYISIINCGLIVDLFLSHWAGRGYNGSRVQWRTCHLGVSSRQAVWNTPQADPGFLVMLLLCPWMAAASDVAQLLVQQVHTHRRAAITSSGLI